jgi:hypothetical protein
MSTAYSHHMSGWHALSNESACLVVRGDNAYRCPETTLCGHPKQGIQGTWNQSLATWVELGFLGSLSPVAMFTLRMLNFLEPDFWLDIPPEQLGVAQP